MADLIRRLLARLRRDRCFCGRYCRDLDGHLAVDHWHGEIRQHQAMGWRRG